MVSVPCKEWTRRRRVLAIGSASNPFHITDTELKNVRLRFAAEVPVFVDDTCTFENVDVQSGRLVTNGTKWRSTAFDGTDVYNVNALGTFDEEICEWIIVNHKTFYRTIIDCNNLYISFINCDFVECILLNCENVDRSQCKEWTASLYRKKHESYPAYVDGRVGFEVDYTAEAADRKVLRGWFRMEDASLARRTLVRSVSSLSEMSGSFRLLLKQGSEKVAEPKPSVLQQGAEKRVSGDNTVQHLGSHRGGDLGSHRSVLDGVGGNGIGNGIGNGGGNGIGGGGGGGNRNGRGGGEAGGAEGGEDVSSSGDEHGYAKPALPPRKGTKARSEAMGDGEDATYGVHPV